METIRQTLFTSWHFMRWLRLVFGVFFVIQAIQVHDVFLGIAGGFFLLTAIANTGCCGAGGCAVPVRKSTKEERAEIEFEEIKNK